MIVAPLLAAMVLAAPVQTPSLRVSSGVVPDTVTVGDRFRLLLRVSAPPGARVSFAPLPSGDTVQQVDSVRVMPESGGAAAVYPLTAWIAGARHVVRVGVTVRDPSGGTSLVYRVPVRTPFVRSVLPADTAGLKPKPARKPLPLPGPEERHRLLILLGALLLAFLAIYWLYRRWPRRPAAPRPPREAALAALQDLRQGRLVEAGALEAFYTGVVRVLRRYLADLDARWGEELTSTELLEALRGSGVDVDALEELLREAEPVKFAAAVPSAEEARSFWSGARAWVEDNPRSPAPETAGVEG